MKYSIKEIKISLPMWLCELLKKGRYKLNKNEGKNIIKIDKDNIEILLIPSPENVHMPNPFFRRIGNSIYAFDGNSTIFEIKPRKK